VLFLGGLEPRKNLPTLVRGWAAVPDEVRPGLVVAGASVPWNPEGRLELEQALSDLPDRARSQVVQTGYVGHREKVALLAGATALALPSLYEGFGLPILEAMAVGTPVITSNVSSMPEVAGDAAVLVDPRSPSTIAGAIESLVRDEDLRRRLHLAGRDRVRAFSWDEAARRHVEVLHTAAQR
jgi:glycosyltransferase involved in cell wall biosynthesis